ncbi:hypothetical protein [Marinobacter sp.]|uniref:hypothetical protein n=1 Tax=Marinobacter sp. TaxID=50741 RepID=UPI003A95B0D1
MSLLDPELFDRRDPFVPYDMCLEAPLQAKHKDFTMAFGYLIESSQEQLQGRSLAELQFAIEFSNWLMTNAEQRFRHERIFGQSREKAVVFLTDPRKILALFEDYDLNDQAEFPNGTPEDYFAVLALGKCFEAIETHERLTAYGRGETQYMDRSWGDNSEFDVQDSLYHTAISARDSLLSEARDLIAFIDGIHFSQLRAKNSGKRGAKAKNSAFATLNTKLMAVYDERYQHLTNRHAASRLYDDFINEVDHVLRTDDPAHRISIWIGIHKKKLLRTL